MGSTATDSADPLLLTVAITVAFEPNGFALTAVKGTTIVPPLPSARNKLVPSGERTICDTEALVTLNVWSGGAPVPVYAPVVALMGIAFICTVPAAGRNASINHAPLTCMAEATSEEITAPPFPIVKAPPDPIE